MPRHSEKRILPYTPRRLFELIAAVERYPEFLPWCKAARVIERDERGLTADLVIGTKIFTEKFRSRVMLDPPHKIEVRYLSGPLSHLRNQWEFKPKGKSSCELSFEVDFDFHSSLLRGAMEMFFDKAILKMVASFEARAEHLYGAEHRGHNRASGTQ
jgi:coenzyme Q-binding protein COQ10